MLVGASDIEFVAEFDGSAQRYIEALPELWDSSQSYHLIVALHGHGADRHQVPDDSRDECRAMRDIASQFGMILISPDYRASTSWMGPAAELDMLQIIRELRARYKIAKLFICGGSMGGTSALVFTALHPELVDGVCALNPTANMLEYDNFQDAIAESYGGTKKDCPNEYRKRSPELVPERFTMPLSITTGGLDTVVPPQSAMRLAAAAAKFNPDILLVHRPETAHLTNYGDAIAALEFVISRALDTVQA